MEEAVKYATEEQRIDRTFEMYGHAQVEEPMEVCIFVKSPDIVQEGKEAEKLAQIQETVQKLTKQLDRVSRQMR